ncbi:MAG: CDGSH iron-sulfur domain-containing protein [Cyclobacteriaceae bacterium]
MKIVIVVDNLNTQNMAAPKIAAKEPREMELKAGKVYAWCACGQSSNQPFCDGSHKGSAFSPEVFKAEESKTVWFCMCKHTGNKPFCDGTHKKV